MKKWIILLFLLFLPVIMHGDDYSQQQTWVTDETITATKLNLDIGGIIGILNDLTNDNIASTAAIAYSKLNLTGNVATSDLANPKAYFTVALTFDTPNIATTDPISTFQMPFAATLVEISACARRVDSGGTYTIDVEEAGTTVLDAAIDLTTANTPVVGALADTSIGDNAKIEVVLTIGGSSPTIDDITVLMVFKVTHSS